MMSKLPYLRGNVEEQRRAGVVLRQQALHPVVVPEDGRRPRRRLASANQHPTRAHHAASNVHG